MSVACQRRSPGLSFDSLRKLQEGQTKGNSYMDDVKPTEWCTPTSVKQVIVCWKKKKDRMNGFIYNSHPPHMLHAACPCVQYKKNLRNIKSTRWIITNKTICGSPNAERKERGELNCPPHYVFIHGQAKAKKHTHTRVVISMAQISFLTHLSCLRWTTGLY